MDIDKITKTQLIRKLIEQHRKIRILEEKSVENTDTAEDTPEKDIYGFESLLRTNSIGVLTINNKGVITSCNDAILDFSGYKRDDLVGKYFTKRVSLSTKDIPRYMAVFNDILAGREAEPFQIAQNHNNGAVKLGQAVMKFQIFYLFFSFSQLSYIMEYFHAHLPAIILNSSS